MDKNRDKKQKRSMVIILILLLITITAVCVTIWALFFREPEIILTPNYAPHQTEPNQRPIIGDSGDKMDAVEGGGAVSLSYSNQVTIDLSEKLAVLSFANPGKSTQDIVLQIVIQDQIIIQSGRLTPGHQVTELDLLKDAEKMLVSGGYDGMFVLLYYHPETAEKAVLHTQIPISIQVVE